jgi:hypothetical protein
LPRKERSINLSVKFKNKKTCDKNLKDSKTAGEENITKTPATIVTGQLGLEVIQNIGLPVVQCNSSI